MAESEKPEIAQIGDATNCWFLIGATCSGKTTTGVMLAQRINAEIISMDSMAVYRGMDLGTAKPPLEVRQDVPHHMIDIRDPNEEFSVSHFVKESLQLVKEIRERGKRVLFVGGTPLYLKSLLRGMSAGPAADWEFRKAVEAELEQLDLSQLRSRLEQVDPLSAHKLHPNDKRRMIRALEVYRITGEPISHQQTHFDEGSEAEDRIVFSLRWPRLELHERISQRVEQMFDEGFEQEVRELIEKHGELSRTASQAVGYSEVIDLVNGVADRDTAIEKVKTRTRRFARRQETWFRGLSETRWFEMDDEINLEDFVEQLASLGLETESRIGIEQPD